MDKAYPFQTLTPGQSAGRTRMPERISIDVTARASWLREIWATKSVMLSSGLTKDQTFQLAAKAIGWQFTELENLTTRELRIVREFFAEELGHE
jgi:hypothetical protein